MKLKSFCLGGGLVVLGFIVAIVVIVGIFFPARRVYTQDQINTSLKTAVTNQAASENQITAVQVTLEQGKGIITGSWAQGQQLTGEIVVSADGKSLVSQNVVVSNTGPLIAAVYQKVASAVIQAGLNNIVARQGNFKTATIETGKITVQYR